MQATALQSRSGQARVFHTDLLKHARSIAPAETISSALFHARTHNCRWQRISVEAWQRHFLARAWRSRPRGIEAIGPAAGSIAGGGLVPRGEAKHWRGEGADRLAHDGPVSSPPNCYRLKGVTAPLTVMTVPLSLAVRIPACTPESFAGQGPCSLNSPPHPGPSPALGRREIRESRRRLSR